jgi:CDP-glucose 4,6-dehydratase
MIVSGFDWKDKKVLVTGASGFKGGWLCGALLRLGAKVYGTGRNQLHPLSVYNVLSLDRSVVRVNADVSDRQEVYDMVNSIEPEVIFHLAAKALVPVGLRDPRRTFDVNIMGTLNIIEACRKLKVCSRLLICSTDHVFGSVPPEEFPKNGFDEKSRVSYGGPYDTSKSAMELLVRSYHYTYWWEVPALGITRCANVYGYGDTNQRRIIPLFVTSAVNQKTVPLRYRLNGRQFIYVTDAITGYIKAASSLDEGGCRQKAGAVRPERSPFTPTFHFAIENYENTGDHYIRMAHLAELVAGLFDAKVDDTGCIDLAPGENPIQALNCAATASALNWRTSHSLRDSLESLSKWYSCIDDLPTQRDLIEGELAGIASAAAGALA